MSGPPDWPERLSQDQKDSLERIRKKADQATQKPILTHFTDHSIDHFDSVAHNFLGLESCIFSGKHRLNGHELFVGLAASYLHDVALQSSRPTTTKTVSEMGPSDYQEVRKRHPQTVSNWIQIKTNPNREVNDVGKIPDLGLDDPPVINAAVWIAKICEHHSGPPGDTPNLSQDRYDQSAIRLDFLLHLFRLADALDIQSRRVNLSELSRWRVNPESLSHWWRHHYVTSVDILENGSIEVTMKFPTDLSPPYVRWFVQAVRKEPEQEIAYAESIFRKNSFFPKLKDIRTSHGFSQNRRMPPDEVRSFIGQEDNRSETEPADGSAEEPTKAQLDGKGNWIDYWGFEGNPWTDLPVSYQDDSFVLTEDIGNKISELNSLLEGEKGEMIFVFGERGIGKTTFLRTVEEKYEDSYLTTYQDVSSTAEVKSAAQLQARVFPRILSELRTNGAGKETTANDFREEIKKPLRDHPIILIDNLDRYNDEPSSEIIRRFFELSQGRFQAMRQKAIIIISATDEWKPKLGHQDLGYIGKDFFLDLEKFSKADVRSLIENRLKIAGSSFDEVFDAGVVPTVHRISEGNPREVLRLCSSLCRAAAKEELERVGPNLVEERFGTKLQNKILNLTRELANSDTRLAKALDSLYAYHLITERLSVNEEEAWRVLRGLATDEEVEFRNAPDDLGVALNRISSLKTEKVDDGEIRKYWELDPSVSELLDRIADEGVNTNRFIDYFRLSPIRSGEGTAESFVAAISRTDLSDDVRKHLDRATERLEAAKSGDKLPTRSLMDARFCLENLIVAYLKVKEVPLPDDYIESMGGRTFRNEEGLVKEKSSRRLGQEMAALLSTFETGKTEWFNSFREMKLVKDKAADFLYGSSMDIDMDDKDLKVIQNSIDMVYKELVPIITSD